MHAPSSVNTRPHFPLPPFVLVLAVLLSGPVPAALAQQVVWVGGEPSPADSVRLWARQAMAGFQANRGDSAGGANYPAYEKVGLIARRLLRARGGRDLRLAPSLQPTLDSLGLATEIATDPASPRFALLVVHDPQHPVAESVGFLYWLREGDLRMQGLVLRGGHHPRMRTWWVGETEHPYEWGVVDQTRDGHQRFTLLSLAADGSVWGIQQDEEMQPTLGGVGEAQWADLNGDERPELVAWLRATTDSLFTECASCPHLITERTFIESRGVFELQDERLLPTPYATLVLFVRLLIDGHLTQAERLVRDPAKVQAAVAQGWNRRPIRSPWKVESGEANTTWPRRLAVRFQGPNGPRRYDVVFGRRDERWIIEDWFEPRAATERYPSVTLPPSRATTRPPASGSRPATPGRKTK